MIVHDAGRSRFVLDGTRGQARLDYRLRDGVMVLAHTGVPGALRGQGIAGRLVHAALEHARAHGLKVEPRCSYAAAWLERHPGYADLRA